jgi:pyruvate/2-oxoglutarate dehydrogenase complex dihydrolipoamide dehydrogenase (E3) component
VIRASRAAADLRDAERFGVHAGAGSRIDFAAAMRRMRSVRALISHHDSVERFSGLGVDVFLGDARFVGPDAVEVDGQRLRFKRAVIATGARAAHPAIEGLGALGYLTNESVFSLTECPAELSVIGGGPIGCELAQAFQRLGSQVTLIHNKQHVLDREDADAAALVQKALLRDGVRLVLGCGTQRAERRGARKVLVCACPGRHADVTGDEILAGAGRAPNVEGLELERVGVRYDARRGIEVNDRLQTTNPRIYAAGDVCMDWKFTHAADFAARIVIQNALFFGRRKLSSLTMPWCTYTDPEVAHVGLSEHDAARRGITVTTFVRPLSEVDRAVTDGEEEGFVKIHVKQGGDRILGATVVARHAGDMIGELTLAMTAGVGLGRLANVIHPYPTQAEAIRQTGDLYNRTRLTPLVKALFERWLRLTR